MEWGLEAVVMGATNYSNNPTKVEWFENRADNYEYDFSQQSFRSFDGDFLEGSRVFGDLEEVYKPFYPGFQSSGRPIQEMRGFEGRDESPGKSPVAATTDAAMVTKYKRRKKQQKRVVEHVTTDAVPSSDKWAWRKYGQKPIKGSPFPRSYYRCSSSRECLARKQVERSTTDPNSFIISYTEDHNHDLPTRRNALAGSTRSSTSKLPTYNNNSSAASVDLGLLVDSPINSSGDNSPANEGKMVNLSCGGGGFGDEEFSFMGFEEMDWSCI